ncbi:MAG: hypothetical protein O3A81_00365 [bacterium]|nr:hypothetical protein [bacterium]
MPEVWYYKEIRDLQKKNRDQQKEIEKLQRELAEEQRKRQQVEKELIHIAERKKSKPPAFTPQMHH